MWNLALDESLVIVSKDSDFRQLAFLSGPPPKAIWVAIGNCTTADVGSLLRARRDEIRVFVEDARAAFLTLE